MSKSNDPDFLFIVKAITMSIVEWFFKLDPVLRSILIAISVALLVRAVNPNALTFVITISVIVVIFVAFFKEKDVQAKRWNAYLEAKDRLLEEPSNNKLRDLALQAGREYYASLRGGRLTIYDEQAIANDLSSIIPTIPQVDKASEHESYIGKNDIAEKIQKLLELKNSGLISETEFEDKKKKLIDQMLGL
jgi:hypothetical protein